MSILNTLQTTITHPVLSVYLWIWAVGLAWGAMSHVGSMLGKGETSWLRTPRLWQVMDVVLLIFNVVAVIGLVQRTAWSIVWVVGGLIILQFIPYTVFQHHFARTDEDRKTLKSLLGTHALMIGALVILIGLGL